MIDLGDARWSAVELPRPRLARPARPLLLLGVVGTLLLTLAGAAPNAPGMGEPLWSADGVHVSVVAGRAYLFTVEGQIRAVAADTGAEIWRRVIRGSVTEISGLGQGVIGVDVFLVGPSGSGALHVLLLDADTGRDIASIPGSLVGRPAGSVAIVAERAIRGCTEYDSCLDLTGVQPRSGALVWRLPYRSGSELLWDFDGAGRIRGFGVLGYGGTLRRYDVATGAVTSVTDLTIWRGADPALAVSRGELALVFDGVIYRPDRAGPGEDGFGAYQPSASVSYQNLVDGRSWSIALRAARRPGGVSADRCGRWICAFDGSDTMLLDPSTGAVLTTFVGSSVVSVGSLPLLAASPSAATTRRDGLDGQLSLVDPSTGAPTAVIRGLVRWVDAGAAGSLALVTTPPGDRSQVMAVSPSGTIRPLGSIDRALTCDLAADVLVCLHPADPSIPETDRFTVAAWRLPRW